MRSILQDFCRTKVRDNQPGYLTSPISGNREHDLRNYDELKAAGGDYLVIWGCEIKKKNLDSLIEKLSAFIGVGIP
jgi:G:T-mismatch repair DNA endonuclease (very short patch repair protein)